MKNVGLWSSSSPVSSLEMKKGLLVLKKMGINPILPEQSKKYASKPESASRKFLAGPDTSKIETFEELIGDRRFKTIMALRGGAGALRLLPGLDSISGLKNYSKELWGFSDLTIIQNFLFQKSACAWVHSPMLSSKSFYAPNPQEKKRWKALRSSLESKSEDGFDLSIFAASSVASLRPDYRGLLLGGNLASFVSLMGTPWEPRWPKGSFLFLEEISEAPYRLDRLLRQLSYHRDFSSLSGVILGHFTDCLNSKEILRKWANETGVMLLSGLKAGHASPNFPIVMGESVLLKRKNNKVMALTLRRPVFGC